MTSFIYDADARETSRSYPNGVIQTSAYDDSGRITQVKATKGASTLTRFTYSYADAVSGADTDLRQSVTNLAGAATSYTYDVVGRLLRAKTGTASDYQYTYDGVGNRLTQDVNGALTTYSYNAADELTAAGSTTFSYDANGNQTGSSAGQSLTYNGALQTTSVTPPGGSATPMTYAGGGQTSRVSAGSTTYVYDLRGMASETTSGTTTRYVRDPSGALLGERTGSSVYYYLFDGLGSVVGLTGSSGTLVNTYAYDPYGNVTATTGTTFNRWTFAGGYQDAIAGLIKFGQRYYDPILGRWTQPDPAPSSLTDPVELDAYSYSGNDPVNYVDPSGAYRNGIIRPRPRITSGQGCDAGTCGAFQTDPYGNIAWGMWASNFSVRLWTNWRVYVNGVLVASSNNPKYRLILHSYIAASLYNPGDRITITGHSETECWFGWATCINDFMMQFIAG